MYPLVFAFVKERFHEFSLCAYKNDEWCDFMVSIASPALISF